MPGRSAAQRNLLGVCGAIANRCSTIYAKKTGSKGVLSSTDGRCCRSHENSTTLPCRPRTVHARRLGAQCLVDVFDARHVEECFAVTPALHARSDALHALPAKLVQLLAARHGLRAPHRTGTRVVAAEHEAEPLLLGVVLVATPQIAVVHDPCGDVGLRVVDRLQLRVVRLNRFVCRWHELHEAGCADPAPRARHQVALRHALRLEVLPIETRTEETLRVLAEDFVVIVRRTRACLRLEPVARRSRGQKQYDQYCSLQFSAPPMISAIEMKSAPMKIATAMLPRFSSSGKSTCGVAKSISR